MCCGFQLTIGFSMKKPPIPIYVFMHGEIHAEYPVLKQMQHETTNS